jgi:hypothetical protein
MSEYEKQAERQSELARATSKKSGMISKSPDVRRNKVDEMAVGRIALETGTIQFLIARACMNDGRTESEEQ